MARPYSQDLRDRVIGSVASGRTCRLTAALFGVSVASVVKWSQRWRASGSAAAKPMGGRRPLRLQHERAWLLARIAVKPDLTLRAVAAELAERGTPASYGAVWRFFRHEGITFKKNAPASRIAPTTPAAEPGGRRIRAGLTRGAWCSSTRLGQNQHDPPPWPLPPRHAADRQGAARPLAHRTLTFLAALRHDRITARCGRSTAPAFTPISNSSWCPPSAPATSSSWTISAVTRARLCAA
jgi:transposase